MADGVTAPRATVADRAVGIVQNAGGRIDARSETASDERNGGSASLTLRIPSNRLNDQVSMSTIDLSLTTEPVVIVVVDDTPETFWDGLVSGWNALVTFVSVALVIVGVLLPWAALAGLIVVAVIALIRAKRSRAARRAAATTTAAPAAAAAASPPPGPPPA